MTKYTLTWHGTIIDNEDGLHIPQDPDNRHFQEYLAWKAQGNWPNFELDTYALDTVGNRYIATQFSQMKYNLADFPSEVTIP
jgi:hypothetical protein